MTRVNEKLLSREEKRARGIAASGRVARDTDGFTVFSLGEVAEAFRVWHDPDAGERCSCGPFNTAFREGEDFACEHILAVTLFQTPPDDEIGPGEPLPELGRSRIRLVG
jgi:hypothetical protein